MDLQQINRPNVKQKPSKLESFSKILNITQSALGGANAVKNLANLGARSSAGALASFSGSPDRQELLKQRFGLSPAFSRASIAGGR